MMTVSLNQIIHGFKCTSLEWIDEIASDCYLFEHIQTGAKLMYLKNEDNNKVFSVSFKTPSIDNTGAAHIVEHCVLSGSRKYHTKEPFMDMVKGSMSTFINAMTFTDKTMYPVASKTQQDFVNLMDVYLDAVFFPKIYDDETIFMQEGWRHDIQDANDPITYKGIVYNEMKGAYSDPIRSFFNLIDKTVFKDTCYAFESGGHPDAITDLSYEGFLKFHKMYYHPSNAYLYLYGNVDITSTLKHIHEDYLSHFNQMHFDFEMDALKPFDAMRTAHDTYAVSDEEVLEGKDYMGLTYVIGKATDPKIHLTASVLKEMLIESSASPLKKALLEAEIAEDIISGYNDGLYKKFEVILKHTDISKKDVFLKIVNDTLVKLCEEGIDPALIQSSINVVEYDLKEASGFPTKGIIYHMNALESWLYSEDATALLKYSEALETLKNGIESKYFEHFIKEHILNNKTVAFLSMSPEKGKIKTKNEADLLVLDAYKKSLSPDALNALVLKNQKLKEKQLTPDSKEALASIPKLSISDVPKESERFESILVKTQPYTLLHNAIFSNGIGYVEWLFDLCHLSEEDLPYLGLLVSLLGDLSTTNHAYDTLSNEIYLHTGGINVQLMPIKHFHDASKDGLRMALRTKATPEHFQASVSLGLEILTQTQFDDKKRLKELISALKAQLQSSLMDSGNSYVAGRIGAYLSATDAITEKHSGLAFYHFVCDVLANFESQADVLIQTLRALFKKTIRRNGLVVAFTGSEIDFSKYTEALEQLILAIPENQVDDSLAVMPLGILNEGIKSSSNVQYVGSGFNYKSLGFAYEGRLHVLQMILNSEYLHDRVRAKGGAYGCSARFDHAGLFTIVSYRDPNLSDTYQVYEEAIDFIKSLKLEPSELEKFIIGAMSLVDGAKTPKQMGQIATHQFLTQKRYEDIQRIRTEILNVTIEDIVALSDFLEGLRSKRAICTLGNSDIVSENGHLFDHLLTLQS